MVRSKMTSGRQSNLPEKIGIGLVLVLFCCTSILAQESDPEFANGPLQGRSDVMRRLVDLKLGSKGLRPRPHVESTDDEDSDLSPFEQAVQQMMDRGIDARTAERLAQRKLRAKRNRPPIVDTFLELANGLQGGNSMSQSQVGKRLAISFRNVAFSAEIKIEDKMVTMTFQENQDPKRKLVVMDGDYFSFQFTGQEFDIAFEQHRDGHVTLKRSRGDQVENYQADSFIALRKQNSKLVDLWFIPLLEHVGFTPPVLPDASEVQRTVIARLVGRENDTNEDLKRLIMNLDSEVFSTREEASRMLLSQVDQWRFALEKHRDSKHLSPEARTRLDYVLQAANRKYRSEVDEIIEDQDLLSAPNFLIDLFAVAKENEVPVINRHLSAITGQSHSTPRAWRAWWKSEGERNSATPDQNR